MDEGAPQLQQPPGDSARRLWSLLDAVVDVLAAFLPGGRGRTMALGVNRTGRTRRVGWIVAWRAQWPISSSSQPRVVAVGCQ